MTDLERRMASLSEKTGLPNEALGILLILAGVLVLVFPQLIEWFVGLTLILVGAWWLLANWKPRRAAAPPPP